MAVGGGSADHATAEFSTAINSTAIATRASGRFTPLPDGLFRVRGDDWAFGYDLGALVQPRPGTNIGLTYRSRIDHDFSGDATFDGPAPSSLTPAFRDTPATSKLGLPASAGISLTQAIAPGWTGYLDASWTGWSSFQALSVYRDGGGVISSKPERYDDSFFVSAGASYAATGALTLRGGIAFDKTPVSDAYRTARVPDANRYWLAAGASYRILPRVTVDVGYAHLFVDDSTIRELSSTGSVLSGSYSGHVDIVSLGTRMAF